MAALVGAHPRREAVDRAGLLEALARVCASGACRKTTAVSEEEAIARAAEDRQDADAFRILFYTGVRFGEFVTLRLADVDLVGRSLLVRRTISAALRPNRRAAGPDT